VHNSELDSIQGLSRLARPNGQISLTGSGVVGRADRPWSPCSGNGRGWPSSSTDKVSRGRRHEHRGGSGNMPDKMAAVGAHPSSGSTMRGKKGSGSSMFQGGDGVRWRGGRRPGPTAGGGDGGGEARSKRGIRRGHGGAHRGRGRSDGGGLKYGQGRMRFGHQRGQEVEGRGRSACGALQRENGGGRGKGCGGVGHLNGVAEGRGRRGWGLGSVLVWRREKDGGGGNWRGGQAAGTGPWRTGAGGRHTRARCGTEQGSAGSLTCGPEATVTGGVDKTV
jgi:hypothetical protein